MFTEREQEELVNSVLRMPNNIYLSAVPQVPDVPLVPKDVPYVPHVPVSGQFVWQSYYKCQTNYKDPIQENFFNKVLTKIFVGMI